MLVFIQQKLLGNTGAEISLLLRGHSFLTAYWSVKGMKAIGLFHLTLTADWSGSGLLEARKINECIQGPEK